MAPSDEAAPKGETWVEDSPRTLSVNDDVLASGRWVRMMRAEEPTRDDVDGAFLAATAAPAGFITLGGETFDVYREDAKTLLTELARDQAAPGAAEALTILEGVVHDNDGGEISADALGAIILAADTAVNNHTASAPLIRLRSALQQHS
jgi:hypothetical protein